MTDTTPAELNIVDDEAWLAGTTQYIALTITDSGGSAVSLAGSTITYKLRAGSASGTIKVSKDTTTGIVISGAGSNIFTVTVDAADTTLLAGTYYHAALVTFADTTNFIPFIGEVEIKISGMQA